MTVSAVSYFPTLIPDRNIADCVKDAHKILVRNRGSGTQHAPHTTPA